MRIFPQELYIRRLKGELPHGRAYDWVRGQTVEECIDGLRQLSGKDFGNDPEAWSLWWMQERQNLDIDPEF